MYSYGRRQAGTNSPVRGQQHSEVANYLNNSPGKGHSPEKHQLILWNEFELLDMIGSGSFGHVYKCRHVKTGKEYAVKKFKNKYPTKKKAFDQREIQVLQRFDQVEKRNRDAHCPYVMKAERIEFENRRLYLVFELMDMSLTQFIRKRGRKGLLKLDEEHEIKTIAKQILMGLQYMHDELGIMHRDLKPDNIMISENPLQVKIIDFGTCKDLTTESGPHTSYVSTRWYRAPECVLRSHHYNFQSDVFAAGCIMSELYLQHPLFPGTSELDQIDKIFKILGTPKKDQWREGFRLAEKRNMEFEDYPKKNLQKLLEGISDDALEAVKLMVKISAQKRGTAAQVLQLPFFLKPDIKTPSTQETHSKHSPAFSSQSPPQSNNLNRPHVSSRSDLHRMAGEGIQLGQQIPGIQKYDNTNGSYKKIPDINTQERSYSNFRAHQGTNNRDILNYERDRDSSSGTRGNGQVNQQMNQSKFGREANMPQLPQISMARGTIKRNKYNDNSSATSLSPRLGEGQGDERGYYKPSNEFSRNQSRSSYSGADQGPFNNQHSQINQYRSHASNLKSRHTNASPAQFESNYQSNGIAKNTGHTFQGYAHNQRDKSQNGDSFSPGMRRNRNTTGARPQDRSESITSGNTGHVIRNSNNFSAVAARYDHGGEKATEWSTQKHLEDNSRYVSPSYNKYSNTRQSFQRVQNKSDQKTQLNLQKINSGPNYNRNGSALRAKTIPYTQKPQFKSSFYQQKESPRIAVEAINNSRSHLKITDEYDEEMDKYDRLYDKQDHIQNKHIQNQGNTFINQHGYEMQINPNFIDDVNHVQIVHKTAEKRGPSMTHRQGDGSSSNGSGLNNQFITSQNQGQQSNFSAISRGTDRKQGLNPSYQQNNSQYKYQQDQYVSPSNNSGYRRIPGKPAMARNASNPRGGFW